MAAVLTAHSPMTDVANAARFANEHGDSIRYVGKSRRWLVWDGKRWRDDDTNEVQRRAKETVKGLYTAAEGVDDDGKIVRLALSAQRAGRIAGMIELAKSEPGIAVMPEQLDADPWLLNVENGTLDLRTGRLRPHRPDDLITKLAPVEYDEHAECKEWLTFLDTIFKKDADLIRYVQKVIGYALTGDAREQCFFILYGTGQNGKTTLVMAISGAVGNYAQHTPTQTLLVKKSETIPNDVARLHGARLVTASENECTGQLAEALVKQVTGGDKVSARFLHGEFFEFTPQFKLLFSTNHKPVVKGTDLAIWRRIRLVPFDVTIPEEERDRKLPERLAGERAGILRWAVDGCLAWQRDGLKPPPAVIAATAGYREEMDTVGPFIETCCVLDPAVETTPKRLYDAYKAWCAKEGEQPMRQADFGTRLQERGFIPGRRHGGRFWRGIGLAEQSVVSP